MPKDLESRLRSSYKCECGALMECKLRAVGKERTCPVCKKKFVVPHPEPPPDGPLWNVPYRLSLEEYMRYEHALVEYNAAVEAHKANLKLHAEILGMLTVIADFKNHYVGKSDSEDMLSRFV